MLAFTMIKTLDGVSGSSTRELLEMITVSNRWNDVLTLVTV